MPDQNSQPQMNADDAKASLGIATALQQQLMPQAPQDAAQTSEPNGQSPAPEPPTNQTTPEDTQAQMEGLESRIMDELGTLRDEVKQVAGKDTGKELEDIKKQIQTILDSND